MKTIFFVVLSFFILAQNYAFAQKMPWANQSAQAKASANGHTAASGGLDMEGLSIAIRAQDINLVKQLVTKQNVNTSDEKGLFPLYVAAKDGDEVMINLILEKGADINYIAPGKKLTALCAACARQNAFTINALLKRKADPNKCPALTYLVSGKVDSDKEVDLLIRHGAKVNATGYLRATPLMLAAAFSKPKSVKVLLKNNADHTVVINNLTPLSAALTGIGKPEALEVIKTLVAHGATLSAANAARKEGAPLWQDKYKVETFDADKQKEAEKLISYLHELASGKPHKAEPAKAAVAPVKAPVKKAVAKAAPAAKK